MKSPDFRGWLRFAMETELDPAMEAHGFSRPAKSMNYRRNVIEGTQGLEMYFDFRPPYEPTALAHLTPTVSFFFPAINSLLAEMSDGDAWLTRIVVHQTLTFRLSLDHVAPKGACEQWYVYDEQSGTNVVRSIRTFVEEWALPLVADYQTLTDITRRYEMKDDRLRHLGRESNFAIVAAYLLLEMPHQAMQVLETHFGKLGPRRRYARIFEFVASRIEKT